MLLEAGLLIILLSALCFLTRIYWRLRHPNFGNDTWSHLGVARAIRKNHYRLPATAGIHFNDGPWDYPPLLPYIMALFSEKRAMGASRYIPAVFDTLSCAATGAFLYFAVLWGRAIWPFSPGHLLGAVPAELLVPALGMLVWTFTPMTAIDTFQHLSPRPMGNFFMVLTVMLMLLYLWTARWECLALMLLPVTLIYLSHKFTLQALTFLNIAVALYLRQPWFLVVQGLGLLAAVAVSGGHYVRVLRGHLAFMNYYRLNGARKYPGKYGLHRERLMKILKLDLSGNPWIYFIVPALYIGGWPPDLLTAMALAMVVCYILVSLNPLLFLGEPERYFETATFPLAFTVPFFLTSRAAGGWELYLWAFFAVLLALGAVRIWREMRGREEQMADPSRVIEHHVDPLWLETCEFMKKRPGERIITVPEYAQWATHYFTGKLVQGTECAAEYGRHMEEFPPTPQNIQGLVVKYHVDLVLASRAASAGFDFTPWRKVFGNERYEVYETGPSTGNH
jgi:hypothetical protein